MFYSYKSNKPKKRRQLQWCHSLRSTITLDKRKEITKKCRMTMTTFWRKESMRISNQQLKSLKVKKRCTPKKMLILSTPKKWSKQDFNLAFLKLFKRRPRSTMLIQSSSKCKMSCWRWLRARAQLLPNNNLWVRAVPWLIITVKLTSTVLSTN